MIPHVVSALTTQLEMVLGGLAHAATHVSRRDKRYPTLLSPGEILALFSELSDEMARAVSVNPIELERLIGMIDAVEQLSHVPHSLGERPSPLHNPLGFFPRHDRDVFPDLDTSFEKNVSSYQAETASSSPKFFSKHFPRKLSKNDRFGLYLALQSLMSFCRSISTTEEVRAAFQWTIRTYVPQDSTRRTIHPLIPLVPEVPQTTARSEIRAAIETREKVRAELRLRSQDITQPDFIMKTVYPLLFDKPSDGPSPGYSASIVHEIGSGRITVSYQFDGKTLAFGKLYTDAAEALHCTRVMTELWNDGFDITSYYRVPELLAYLPEQRMIITKAAEGTQFSSLLEKRDLELSTFVARQAARWLVELHSTPARIGAEATLWNSMELFRLLRRLTKAASRVPEQRKSLVELVNRVSEAGTTSYKDIPAVQVHGKFHYEHVLIEGPATTVIDFDGSLPSDPAVDLVEFLRVMRWRAYKISGDSHFAEGPSRAFLEEYRSHLPENCGNLGLYWAASTLLILLRKAKKYDPGDESFNRKMQFLNDEFDSILSGGLPVGLGGDLTF